MNDKNPMRLEEILIYLPQRYPFLLVDRVLECLPGDRIVAIKNVTVNEPYFQGHFPGRPVMPGVLIIESLAQAAGILAFRTANQKPDDESTFYFVGIDKARFRAPVVPGDQLVLEARFERRIRSIWKFATIGRVDGQEVASAEMMVAPKGGVR
jgi:3-hydroxyacyl-[acyl-carrier-protein] dehydratase